MREMREMRTDTQGGYFYYPLWVWL